MDAKEEISESDLAKDRAFMDLYSRQIGTFGLDAMVKLVRLKVLVVGVRGLGIEICKNAALAGVHTLALHDDSPTQLPDLGTNFFLSEEDVTAGRSRAGACVDKVAELNANVNLVCVEGPLTEEIVGSYHFVVFTSGTRADLIKWNTFCRTQPQPISFMYVNTSGASGSLFIDHGPSFVIRDADGKDPLVKIIDKVTEKEDDKGNKYVEVRYITPDGQSTEALNSSGLIEISEAEGLCCDAFKSDTNTEGSINKVGPIRCSVEKDDPRFSFRINLPSGKDGSCTPVHGLTPWQGGGVITEKKEPKTVQFRSLEECFKAPGSLNEGIVMSDLTFSMSELQIHVGYQAIFAFEEKHGRRPTRGDVDEVIALAKEFDAANNVLAICGGVKEETIATMAATCNAELQPMCAFYGGVAAQELVKISGKFTPIHQFLNFHCFEALPEESPTDTEPIGSRYDQLISVYGKKFQEMLGNLNIFMVGCGALGCEFMKNFALLGVCCGPQGMLTVTDNDTIEVSNLNRQFLFRSENVGQMKSEAASARATTMNKDIRINALKDLVAPHTEHIFNDEFYAGLDLVCNALDNMKARFYVDERCIFFEKPLLESGTMGTGANVDIVVPHMTQSYADGGQADEGGGVPMCTLRNFPHLIDHCIEWSRAQFEDLFVSPAQEADKFAQNPQAFVQKIKHDVFGVTDAARKQTAIANALVSLPLLKTTLEYGCDATIEKCVALAYQIFHTLFRDKIIDLVTAYPEDAKTDSGDPFWSGHKKFPQQAVYDPSNQTHVDFMISATNLFACMLKVHPEKHPSEQNDAANRWMAQFRDPTFLAKCLESITVPEYTKGKVSMEGDENANAADDDDDEDAKRVEAYLDELLALAGSLEGGKGFEPLDFEKDDDDNFHIDFISACSNLRAFNYCIPAAPRHKCKMVAGRIIPAIATTTASVTGLVMMEMFKVLQRKPIEMLRNGNYSLASNTYMMFEANPPASIKDEVVINMPDPKQFPDAYNEKGELKPEYKDPDMMLGFAETVRRHPNPHTKYDKFWLEDTKDMTVAELRDAASALFKEEGLEVTMISGPPMRLEVEKSAEDKSGQGTGSRALWNALISSTNANLDKKWVPLLKELTTRSDDFKTLDDPVDISDRLLYSGLTFSFENEDGDDVTTAPIIVKLGKFDFVSYKDRKPKEHQAWL